MGKNKFRLFDRIRPIAFNINIPVPNSSTYFPFLPLMSQPHRDKMKFYSGAYIKRMTLVNESQNWNKNINTYDFTLSNASSKRINKSMFDLLKHFTYIDENGIEIPSNIIHSLSPTAAQ